MGGFTVTRVPVSIRYRRKVWRRSPVVQQCRWLKARDRISTVIMASITKQARADDPARRGNQHGDIRLYSMNTKTIAASTSSGIETAGTTSGAQAGLIADDEDDHRRIERARGGAADHLRFTTSGWFADFVARHFQQ